MADRLGDVGAALAAVEGVKGGQVEARVVTNFMLVYSRSVLKGKEMMDHIKKADTVLKTI